jgi:uncharacterized membrane protein
MKDRKFIYAVIYFLIGLFCVTWGSVIYLSYPHLVETMKLALKASWIQYVVGFMASLYLNNKKNYGNKKNDWQRL